MGSSSASSAPWPDSRNALAKRLRADRTTTGRPPTNTPPPCSLRTRPSALSTSTAGRAVIRVTPAEIACLADASALGAGVRRCLQAGCASASWLDCAGVESISCTAWSTWPRRSWRSRSAAVRAAQDPRRPPPDRAPSLRGRRAGAAPTSTGGARPRRVDRRLGRSRRPSWRRKAFFWTRRPNQTRMPARHRPDESISAG
jgi:hypothetical protein